MKLVDKIFDRFGYSLIPNKVQQEFDLELDVMTVAFENTKNDLEHHLKEKDKFEYAIATKLAQRDAECVEACTELESKITEYREENHELLAFKYSQQCKMDELKLEVENLSDRLSKHFWGNYANYKKAYIDYRMQKIRKEANEGCGSYYEIYEENQQGLMSGFIDRNQDALSDQDIRYIKSEYGYVEDYTPYTEIDSETGESHTIKEIALRNSI